MDRLSYIEQFAHNASPFDKNGFINAFVRCLTEEEAVELLRRSLGQDTTLRSPALRKVCSDIRRQNPSDASGLVAELQQLILSGQPRRRAGYAHCLLEIARVSDQGTRIGVQAFLSTSKYVGLRRRGYKLYEPDSSRSRELLEQAWAQFQDREVAWLIVKSFPVDSLLQHKDDLVNNLTEGWQLSRFYLRLAESDPSHAEELFELDPISYAYVQAKLGRMVAGETLAAIFRGNLGDERMGLFLWCLGELKQWDQLVVAAQSIDEIAAARLKGLP